jgi:hypothetical protein
MCALSEHGVCLRFLLGHYVSLGQLQYSSYLKANFRPMSFRNISVLFVIENILKLGSKNIEKYKKEVR